MIKHQPQTLSFIIESSVLARWNHVVPHKEHEIDLPLNKAIKKVLVKTQHKQT